MSRILAFKSFLPKGWVRSRTPRTQAEHSQPAAPFPSSFSSKRKPGRSVTAGAKRGWKGKVGYEKQLCVSHSLLLPIFSSMGGQWKNRVKKGISALLQPWCEVVAMSKPAQGTTWECFAQHSPFHCLSRGRRYLHRCVSWQPCHTAWGCWNRVGWDREATAW